MAKPNRARGRALSKAVEETCHNHTTVLPPDCVIDKTGRVRRTRGEVPTCECCDKHQAKVLMEIGYYRGDWLIKQCDRCAAYVCDNCCDTDDQGTVTCVDCLATDAVKAKGD